LLVICGMTAEELKLKGNDAYKLGDYEEAVKHYSSALKAADSKSKSAIYSNRSAAYIYLEKYEDSLKDANSCLAWDPRFIKGYTRKAFAHMCMKEPKLAEQAFLDGLSMDPSNAALLNGYHEIQRMQKPGGDQPGSVWGDIKMYASSAVNPLGLGLRAWLLYTSVIIGVVYSVMYYRTIQGWIWAGRADPDAL